MLNRLLLVGVLLAGMMSWGCTSNEAPPPPMTIHEIDVAHVQAVQASLHSDPELAGEGIHVSAKGDTVVLDGTVQTDAEKERANKIAQGVRGVEKVQNNITVEPRTP